MENVKMENAKDELLKIFEAANFSVKCAKIKYECEYDKYLHFSLKINYTQDEMRKFYESLDFEYDGGYGSQRLYGTIWLNDGTWLERREYDGSEWWEHQVCPDIPDSLIIKNDS